jgi:hypothetical protein
MGAAPRKGYEECPVCGASIHRNHAEKHHNGYACHSRAVMRSVASRVRASKEKMTREGRVFVHAGRLGILQRAGITDIVFAEHEYQPGVNARASDATRDIRFGNYAPSWAVVILEANIGLADRQALLSRMQADPEFRKLALSVYALGGAVALHDLVPHGTVRSRRTP